MRGTYNENTYTFAVVRDDSYRVPLAAEASRYELLQLRLQPTDPAITTLFPFDTLQAQVAQASDGTHDIAYENLAPTLAPGEGYRRLLERRRTYYRPDDPGPPPGHSPALHHFHTLE